MKRRNPNGTLRGNYNGKIVIVEPFEEGDKTTNIISNSSKLLKEFKNYHEVIKPGFFRVAVPVKDIILFNSLSVAA